MGKVAVIDIDNTLWQFCDAFYEELRKINSHFPTPDKWTAFDIWEGYCSEADFLAPSIGYIFSKTALRISPIPRQGIFSPRLRERGITSSSPAIGHLIQEIRRNDGSHATVLCMTNSIFLLTRPHCSRTLMWSWMIHHIPLKRPWRAVSWEQGSSSPGTGHVQTMASGFFKILTVSCSTSSRCPGRHFADKALPWYSPQAPFSALPHP